MGDSLYGQNLLALWALVEYTSYKQNIPTHSLLFHLQRHLGGHEQSLRPPTGYLQVSNLAMSSQLPDQRKCVLSVRSLPMPSRAGGGCLGFAYALLYSRYPTRPGTARVLGHSFFLQSCSRLWFALPQEASVCNAA